MTPSSEDMETAGVAVRPPVLFLSALLLGCLLEFVWPLGAGLLNSSLVRVAAGAVLVCAGAALLVAAMGKFKAAGTNVPTVLPSTALVTTGVYARTRNPIYLGLSAIYAGLAVGLNTWWAILLLAPILVILQVGVVKREERYLERKFGDDYRAYCTRVRRWI